MYVSIIAMLSCIFPEKMREDGEKKEHSLYGRSPRQHFQDQKPFLPCFNLKNMTVMLKEGREGQMLKNGMTYQLGVYGALIARPGQQEYLITCNLIVVFNPWGGAI